MRIAVLPLNAAEGTNPALARQLAFFVAEIVRAHSEAEVAAPRFQTEVEENGLRRVAYVNVADAMLEDEMLDQMFQQMEPSLVVDGLLTTTEGAFDIKVRFTKQGETGAPIHEKHVLRDEIFVFLDWMIRETLVQAGFPSPEEDALQLGTESAEAFLKFLEAYDSVVYIQEANGAVASAFTPQTSFDLFLEAMDLDPDFEAPYDSLVQLARLCSQGQIGTFDGVKSALEAAIAKYPEDYKATFALGELFAQIGDGVSASNQFEKAIAIEPNEAALYTRLALAQMQAGMPVNAERNIKKAIEMEGEDKPSLDFLSMILSESGRAHEVPALWKEQIQRTPNSPEAHTKYAMALINSGKQEEGEAAFEKGLELEDETGIVKRAYAPYLAQVKNDPDRALDFYEDALDINPADVDLMLEYAQTLDQANREVDLPEVLNQILSISQDTNVRAQVMARLIELEQPKRVEGVSRAEEKLRENDPESAARELKPLKTWLGDYWKFWYVYGSANNRVGDYVEAEDALKRLLNMFPNCEPAYTEIYTALHSQNKDEEAYNMLRFLSANLPPNLTLHLTLARSAKSAGHAEEARQLVRSIREAVGENKDLEPVLAEIEA